MTTVKAFFGISILADFDTNIISGDLPVSLPGFPLPTDNMILETTSQLPEQFPFNLDYNSGDTVGVGWSQSTVCLVGIQSTY